MHLIRIYLLNNDLFPLTDIYSFFVDHKTKISILDIKPIGKITMVQKLLVMERDTKEELQKAINKELKDGQFIVRSCTVLKELSGYEAWIVIDDQTEELAGFE